MESKIIMTKEKKKKETEFFDIDKEYKDWGAISTNWSNLFESSRKPKKPRKNKSNEEKSTILE